MHKKIYYSLFFVCLSMPQIAFAQFKNSSFSLELGYQFTTKPSSLDEDNSELSIDKRPLRLNNNIINFGGELNFKMNTDKFWLSFRFDFTPYTHVKSTDNERQKIWDEEASEAIGTIWGIRGQTAIRYFFFTNKFRPYIQSGLSYSRLIPTGSNFSTTCSDTTQFCNGTTTNGDYYLPHRNIGALTGRFGNEIIFDRDIGFHFFAEYQRWLILNTTDNNVLYFALGIVFFT